MLIPYTEMHLVTGLIIFVELFLFFYQFIYYLQWPDDRSRFLYLILLAFLIFYNVSGGLLPDPDIPISIILQNIVAYGGGFLMASYFPFFFYKSFGLYQLKWHALRGVPLFLLIPYFGVFIIWYPTHGDLEEAIK